MKKNVWIFNHYATGMLFDKGGRHYLFAKFLKREGYEPTIFGCNVKHNEYGRFIDTDDLWTVKRAEEINVPFIFVKSNLYKGNGKDRVFNMIQFYWNVKKAAKEYAKTHDKPDIIYASSVHPLTLVAGIQLAEYFDVKCICEVRDLWPLSLVEYGYLRENSLITKLLFKGEYWIYKKSDAILALCAGINDYFLEKGWDIPRDKVFCIYNGVDIEMFDYNQTHLTIYDDDLRDENVFKVIYAGSIRQVNNLGKLLDTAKLVNNRKVKFLIWGNGDELHKLKERVKKENITNVTFKGHVDKCYIPYILSKADLNFAHNNSSLLFRFGVSFNKIFEYLASGKPVLCDFDSKYNPIIDCKAGVCVKSGLEKDIAIAVDKFADMECKELAVYGQNARKGAYEYDFAALTKRLIKIIENL